MKSKYSPRIYEILKSYSNQTFIRISINDFKDLLMIKKAEYSLWCDFKKRILVKTLDEINNMTDLTVNYKAVKKRRNVNYISFCINKKTISELINVWDENKKNIRKLNNINKKDWTRCPIFFVAFL